MPSCVPGAERDARVGLLDERRDALASRLGVGDRHHRVVLGDAGVGDPPLHAVEHPLITVAHGPGLHADRIRARLGLGEAVGAALAASRPRYFAFSSSEPASCTGSEPSLFTAGDQAGRHAGPRRPPRSRSPWPARPRRHRRTVPGRAGRGRGQQRVGRLLRERAFSSTSAANGATASHTARTASRMARCSSERQYMKRRSSGFCSFVSRCRSRGRSCDQQPRVDHPVEQRRGCVQRSLNSS